MADLGVSEAESASRRTPALALNAIPVLTLLVMGWQHRWMSDDGFINLRIVRNLVAGNGPVFNVGERVEASTSPLWVLMLSVVEPIPGGISLPWKAVGLGIGLSVAGLVAAQAAAATLGATRTSLVRPTVTLPLGAYVVAALRPFWDFASSGLETGLSFAWIGASCWWIARRTTASSMPSRRGELAGAALLGAGWMIRPDLVIFSVVFGAVLLGTLWRPTSRRRVAGTMLAFAGPALVSEVFRMGYYGMLVPNTALAKEASLAQWGQGWRYLLNLVNPYWLWLPLLVLVAILAWQIRTELDAGHRLQAAARVAPAVAGLLHGVYVTRAGGDFMHARLLLPSLFGLVAPIGVPLSAVVPERSAAARWLPPGDRALHSLALGGVAIWAVVVVVVPPSPTAIREHNIQDERVHYQLWIGLDDPVRLDLEAKEAGITELWLPAREGRLTVFTPDLVNVAVDLDTDLPVDAGAVPPGVGTGSYSMDLDVYSVDVGGLAHPVGSHIAGLSGDRMGHQKWLPTAWQVAGMSSATEVRTSDGDLLATRLDVIAANEALACGELDRYLRDIREPLTPSRFLGNVVDSFANTLFRVPADPVQAEEQLCD